METSSGFQPKYWRVLKLLLTGEPLGGSRGGVVQPWGSLGIVYISPWLQLASGFSSSCVPSG